MSRIRIKICGLTTPEEATTAAQLGADALGLVMYPRSPRAVSIEQAAEISSAIPPFVSTVVLLVDASPDDIETVCTHIRPSYLQFHGNESVDACTRWKYPYIKALRIKPDTNISEAMQHHINPWCRGILLDAYRADVPGGTGETFDWALIPPPKTRQLPIVLAGGLTPANVKNAVTQVHPWAVDVSSGVEYAPGRKCPEKMQAFIDNLRACS